jgi:hypothetical protein
MPEYKGTIEVRFRADDEDEADVHLLECADYLETMSWCSRQRAEPSKRCE